MNTPVYIAGPCSAESRGQVMETARAIQAAFGSVPFIFRAGVWKPRTNPHTFQGAGAQALEWLQDVQRTYHVPVATEVATPEHVQAALAAGIDCLWIGARTSANPIAVQEIAEAIRRQLSAVSAQAPQTVLVKNPVNADAQLWAGNIERLEQTGVPVMAVHRGCNHQPCWSLAHALRSARPDIPLLLDPSHLSGDAARVPELTEKINELGLDGMMVEVHCNPSAALSDQAQQITPDALSRLLSVVSPQPSENVELNWMRAEIDELDDRLWDTLAARMDVSRRIGEWKKAHGVTPLQPERFRQIVDKRIAWTQKSGLDAAFVKELFDSIHHESLRMQE